VAEDFAPFDVDVTTQALPLDRLRRKGEQDANWGVRIVIGGTCTQWYKPDIAGVAYRGSFTWDTDTPGFVFEEDCLNGDPYATALTTSHEIGHALELRHDGRAMAGEEYYRGHLGSRGLKFLQRDAVLGLPCLSAIRVSPQNDGGCGRG